MVSFNRVWGGYRFTDADCQALCEGKEITIQPISTKTGKPYGCKGVLEKQSYKGREFYGFNRTGFADNVPNSWCGHTFTDDEKKKLEKGESVALFGCTSKAGKSFDCTIAYGDDGKGGKSLIPSFGK